MSINVFKTARYFNMTRGGFTPAAIDATKAERLAKQNSVIAKSDRSIASAKNPRVKLARRIKQARAMTGKRGYASVAGFMPTPKRPVNGKWAYAPTKANYVKHVRAANGASAAVKKAWATRKRKYGASGSGKGKGVKRSRGRK